MDRPVRKAVIPAAGLGTRFLPATKAQPKEMVPLVDKPAIQYVVEEAVSVGITDILVVTGRGSARSRTTSTARSSSSTSSKRAESSRSGTDEGDRLDGGRSTTCAKGSPSDSGTRSPWPGPMSAKRRSRSRSPTISCTRVWRSRQMIAAHGRTGHRTGLEGRPQTGRFPLRLLVAEPRATRSSRSATIVEKPSPSSSFAPGCDGPLVLTPGFSTPSK